MKDKSDRPLRIDEDFYKMIKNIKVERIKLGTDILPKSDKRITKAITKLVYSEPLIYQTLIKTPMEEDLIKQRRRKK